VQQWIDAGHLRGRAVSVEGIREIHQRFCMLLPEDTLWVEEPDTHERLRIVPGELRRRDVKVGRHIPVSAGAIPRFLAHFEAAYLRLGKPDAILSAAAAHHRLQWIHPSSTGTGGSLA
jgi:Fic family protein